MWRYEEGHMFHQYMEEFKADLKRQFYSENDEDETRGKLWCLTQKGSIRDYVKEFSELLLEIPNIGEDSLFSFMDGLAGWAKMELQRRGVQTLVQTMQVDESLIEFKMIGDLSKPKDKREKPTKGGGKRRNHLKNPHLSRHLRRENSATTPMEEAIVWRS